MTRHKRELPADYAQRSGKWFVVENRVDDSARTISALFDTDTEAREALDQLRRQFPQAGLAYYPTPAELDKEDRERREQAKFHVTYWLVHHTVFEGNKRLRGVPLSAMFSTREKARAAYRVIKAQYPDAQVGKWRYLFHPAREQDVKARAELLAQIT